MKKLKNYLRILTLLYAVWIVLGGKTNYLFMIWNIILAWVPLELSSLIYKFDKASNKRKYKIIGVILWILWVLFYPNAPYMITDFIHINSSKFTILNPNYIPYGSQPRTIFNDNFKIWLNFITIAMGVWLGYMLGFISLYLNQSFIKSKFGKIKGWIFSIAVSFLSGFAIYLGRFIRWNSWDVIFKPSNMISIMINDIHFKAIYFTLLFGMFNLILYFMCYVVVKFIRES